MHRFERAAADDIRGKLQDVRGPIVVRAELDGPFNSLSGGLQSVEIRASQFRTSGLPLFCEPDRSQKGKVSELRLDLRDFFLKNLRVEQLTATIPDCRYDFAMALSKRKIRVTRSGEGVGRVRIRQEDLVPFILAKYREIKRVSVRIQHGRVWVEGYGEFLVASTNFRVRANLGVQDGRKLFLKDCTVWLDGQRALGITRDALLKTLNPVVNLDRDLDLFGAIDVRSVSTGDGFLEAEGIVRIPTRPPAVLQTPDELSGAVSGGAAVR